MKIFSLTSFFLTLVLCSLEAQSPKDWSVRMATTLMTTYPDSFCYDKGKTARWDYELGLYTKSLEQLWHQTGDATYFQYIRKLMDAYVEDDGNIRTYKKEVYNIDHITPGRPVLMLWKETGKEKYRLAVDLLRQQLSEHPRTKDGGFWHKKRYPWQMWLDGLYMGEPFYAEYSLLFDQPQNFDDIASQFILMEKHARDAETGLLYHAWDESREQQWADKSSGKSPNFWGRSMGWYAMGLVDVLDYFPEDHPQRPALIAILKRLASAVCKVQDAASGVWYQVPDQAEKAGNYKEASVSCMLSYALLKGARLGYIDGFYAAAGKKAFEGILKEFMVEDDAGMWHLDKVCSVAGLGGKPYRDGTFEYYISEPVRQDDIKGAGPFILACLEMERLINNPIGAGQTVMLDAYFNNEFRNGQAFHYRWEDTENSGFSWWGQIFRDYGAQTATLHEAPSAARLKNAQVFIIVDPDTKKETESPNFIEAKHIEAIKSWVADGGTLVLLANDTSNCEIPHFNALASEFGIRFSDKNRNMVQKSQFDQGAITVAEGNTIFTTSKKLYIKELSVLEVAAPAQAVLLDGGDVIMATAAFGKGQVFALGDPWLYNEYVDGKKIPAAFENFTAASELALWLLSQQETKAVAARAEMFREALISGSREALDQLTTAELSYGHSSGKIENKAAFIDQLVSGRSDFTDIKVADQSIQVLGETAIVRHVISATTNDKGKGPGAIQLKILLVWVKQHGNWQLLARQAVKN